MNDRPQFGCSHSHSWAGDGTSRAWGVGTGRLCNSSRQLSPEPTLDDRLELSFGDVKNDLEELFVGSLVRSSSSSGISNSWNRHHSTPSNILSLHNSSSALRISNPSPQWSRLSADPKDAPSWLGDSVVPGQQKSSRLASGQRHASRPSD